MVLLSLQSHCKSSADSSDDAEQHYIAAEPQTTLISLGYESALGCSRLHPLWCVVGVATPSQWLGGVMVRMLDL